VPQIRQAAPHALVALPALLTVYLSFSAGGLFAGTQSVTTVVLLVVLAVRITFERGTLRGLPRGLIAGLRLGHPSDRTAR
jgi:thiamine transporter ThiT